MDKLASRPTGTTKTSAIFSELRSNIIGGRYAEAAFPSERALMRRFGVSRTLVRQIIAMLKSDGLLASMHGKGTFVPPHAKRMRERIGFIVPGIGREEFFSPLPKALTSFSQRKGFTPVFADLGAASARGRYRMVKQAVREFIAQKVSAVAYQPIDFLSDSPRRNAELLESSSSARTYRSSSWTTTSCPAPTAASSTSSAWTISTLAGLWDVTSSSAEQGASPS